MPDGLPTRILLADDHALVRHGVRLILEAEPEFTVVAEAADGAAAVDAVRDGGVDLAVLDIAMPTMTGLQATREIARIARRYGSCCCPCTTTSSTSTRR